MRIKELRAKAREDAQGNKWKLALPFFLLTSIIYLLGVIPANMPEGAGQVIAGIIALCAIIFITIAGSYAITIRYMKIARKEELNGFFSDMFGEGIKHGFSCAWGVLKKMFGWIILMIVGYSLVIVGAIAQGSTYISEYPTFTETANSSPIYTVLVIIGIILLFISAIKVITKSYQYYIITFLKHDYPEKSTSELLDKSAEMMEGNKAKAFVIPFTLLGWMLLSMLVGVVVSVIFNLIWPPVVTFGVSTATMPLWAEIIQQIIIYFISSFVSAYLYMTFVEFYFERNPLEIYNEDYVKPETNPSKYKKIVGWIIALFVILYIVIGVIVGIFIFNTANSMTDDAINSMDRLMENMEVTE